MDEFLIPNQNKEEFERFAPIFPGSFCFSQQVDIIIPRYNKFREIFLDFQTGFIRRES